MRTGDRKCLSQVLSIGDRGMRALMDEHDDVRNQWNRLFMLYKVLSLLGIYSDFQMSDVFLSPEKVDQAKIILNEMRGSFIGIESRREMIYSLCMARAHEKSDLEKAIDYANEAVRLSQICSAFIPTENVNIKRYLISLKRQHMKRLCFQWILSMPQYYHALVFLLLAIIYWYFQERFEAYFG